MWREALFYLVVVPILGAYAYHKSPKHEGEICQSLKGEQWTCQRIKQCSVFSKLAKSKHLVMCKSRGMEKVVCCPKASKPISISEKMCQQYQQTACFKNKNVAMSNSNHNDKINEDFMEDKPLDDWVNPDVAVFGGEAAKPGEFPHSVLIGYGEDSPQYWACGGSLISKNYVLSAAHCANGSVGLARWALLGDVNYATDTDKATPQTYKIVERLLHSDYEESQYYDDVALFRLETDVVFTPYVAPACLYQVPRVPPGMGTAVGWGVTDMNYTLSSNLMKVNLELIPPEKCNETLIKLDNDNRLPNGVNSRMFCAVKEGKTMCDGDSGGGIVLPDKGEDCLHRLVGVESFVASKCLSHDLPSSYSMVAAYISWIERNVWGRSR